MHQSFWRVFFHCYAHICRVFLRHDMHIFVWSIQSGGTHGDTVRHLCKLMHLCFLSHLVWLTVTSRLFNDLWTDPLGRSGRTVAVTFVTLVTLILFWLIDWSSQGPTVRGQFPCFSCPLWPLFVRYMVHNCRNCHNCINVEKLLRK